MGGRIMGGWFQVIQIPSDEVVLLKFRCGDWTEYFGIPNWGVGRPAKVVKGREAREGGYRLFCSGREIAAKPLARAA